MMEVIPAIMPESLKDLASKAGLVRDKVQTVQLDLMDGVFVPPKIWPFPHLKKSLEEIRESGLPFWQDLNYELDLMVKNASEKLDDLLLLGPSRIIFHIEAEESLDIGKIRERVGGVIEIGLAIGTTTPVEKLDPFIKDINFVQCMGIEKIGYQGNPPDPRVFDHIKSLKNKYPELLISVDGGVNLETAPKLIKAGATRLVIGSAIFDSENIHKAIGDFRSIINE
jgi:ribulose-phosphate 3-epimerase